eukprot:TRINITY_DN5516_c0_g4_i3.p1 TRINITY_DN5516_c0_g4~~TRINITY_DN5516_c0_g4_i3.p1  ORF type:complete len:598 (+),score=133.12 TRINITY_DN5516_c0_g4_i3:95-1888(+)
MSRMIPSSVMINQIDWCAIHNKARTQYCLVHKQSLCVECSSEHQEKTNCSESKTYITCKKEALNFLADTKTFKEKIDAKTAETGQNLVEAYKANESKDDVVSTYRVVKEAMDYAKRAMLCVGKKDLQFVEKAKLFHAESKLEERIIVRKLKEYAKLRKDLEDCKEDLNQAANKRAICEVFETIPTLYELRDEIKKWLRKSEACKKIEYLKKEIMEKSRKEKFKEIEAAAKEFKKKLISICGDIPKSELVAKSFSDSKAVCEEEKIPSYTTEGEFVISQLVSPLVKGSDSGSDAKMENNYGLSDSLDLVESLYTKEEGKSSSGEAQRIFYAAWPKGSLFIGSIDKRIMRKKISFPHRFPSYAEYIQISNKEILFAGGKDEEDKRVAACFKFNVDGNLFTEVKPMRVAKTNHTLVKADPEIYCLGGIGGEPESELDCVEIFVGDTWVEGPKMCVKAQGVVAAYEKKLYAFGRISEGNFIRSVQALSSGKWEEIQLNIDDIDWSLAVPLNDSILLFAPDNDVWQFSTYTYKATKKAHTLLNEDSFDKNTVKVIADDVYIVGTRTDNLLVFSKDRWRVIESKKWLGYVSDLENIIPKITYR